MEIYLHRRERSFAFAFFIVCFAYIFPDLFFLIKSPMEGTTLTLKDPTVSWSAFMPAFREFRYELFNYGNILWSNLRGMGQPILGNGVQGAPLFPLNILLLPLPDALYWSVMPISRLLLIAFASYLIGRKILGFSVAASLTFALVIGFNINVTRWMNHPWSNGLLAGLWYLYFLCRLSSLSSDRRAWKACLGLIISVYAMISCGFPEASALSALVVIFLYGGWFLSHSRTLLPASKKIFVLLITCHFIGFALGSAQLLALLEFIDHGGSLSLREGFAGGSYNTDDALSYGLAQFSSFWPTNDQHKFLSFSTGLFGLFFAILGITHLTTLRPSRLHLGISLGFLVGMLFFVTKAFALSPALESLFAMTPVLAQSHFPLYFSPLFYLGVAYFAALGFSSLLEKPAIKRTRLIKLIVSLAAYCFVLFLCSFTMLHFNNTAHSRFWTLMLSEHGFLHVQVFAIVGAILILAQGHSVFRDRPNGQRSTLILSLLVITGIVIELDSSLPKQHAGVGYTWLAPSKASKEALAKALENAPLAKHELRSNDRNGALASYGIATVDNGVSAILSPELRQLRLSLFDTKFGGYIQLEKPKTTWSYDALSANIWELHATPFSEPNWSNYSLNKEINSHLLKWPPTPIPLSNPFYLEGTSWAFIDKPTPVEVWLNFIGEKQNIWLKTNLISQRDQGINKGRYKMVSKWRLRIPSNWLSDTQFKVIARQVDVRTNEFHDSEHVNLLLDHEHPVAIAGRQNTLIGESEDGSRTFFYRDSALPRAFVASACRQVETQAQEMAFFTQSDAVMNGEVVLPYDIYKTKQIRDLNGLNCEHYQNKMQRVAITNDKGSRISFAPITGPAVLLLNDSYYPGWHAYDENGEQMPIARANTNARLVYLPDNRSYSISMKYQPTWLLKSLILLIMCIPIAVLLRLYLKKLPESV